MNVETKNKTAADHLVEDIESFHDDPLGFVQYVFAWGEGDLEGHTGPDKWQAELLEDVGRHIREGEGMAYQNAVSSGHGCGKGALTSWLTLHAMCCRKPPRDGRAAVLPVAQLRVAVGTERTALAVQAFVAAVFFRALVL